MEDSPSLLIRRLLIALGMIATLLFVPTQANAAPVTDSTCSLGGRVCGHFTHYAPDTGYDPSIIITCDWPSIDKRGVPEGRNSRRYCTDTDGIYIRHNEELWCYMPKLYWPGVYKWEKKLDAQGWHKINDIWYGGAGCTLRTD